jgi:hypothetical protein
MPRTRANRRAGDAAARQDFSAELNGPANTELAAKPQEHRSTRRIDELGAP